MVETRMCDRCGEPISTARLEAKPTTIHCTGCAASIEEDRKGRPTGHVPENPVSLTAEKERKARAAAERRSRHYDREF